VLLDPLSALIEEWVVDEQGHGTGAADLRRDPAQWARAVTEWGLSLRPVRQDAAQAFADAAELRRRVVALGLSDLDGAQAACEGVMERSRWRRWRVTGWRGTFDPEFPDPDAFAVLVRAPS
jgi:hypothetical protein